jgi:methionine synthase I (cobalamin-dependent)
MSKGKLIINLDGLDNSFKFGELLIDCVYRLDINQPDAVIENFRNLLACKANIKHTNSFGNNIFHFITHYSSDLHIKLYDIAMEYAKDNFSGQIKEILNKQNQDGKTPLSLMVLNKWPESKV